jgi:hypothetical protein
VAGAAESVPLFDDRGSGAGGRVLANADRRVEEPCICPGSRCRPLPASEAGRASDPPRWRRPARARRGGPSQPGRARRRAPAVVKYAAERGTGLLHGHHGCHTRSLSHIDRQQIGADLLHEVPLPGGEPACVSEPEPCAQRVVPCSQHFDPDGSERAQPPVRRRGRADEKRRLSRPKNDRQRHPRGRRVCLFARAGTTVSLLENGRRLDH